MLNILLNRYYITNANRSMVLAETQEKVQSLLSKGKIGEAQASGVSASLPGKDPHKRLQRELQGLWMRHLVNEEEQTGCHGSFCKKQ